ncbi:MAG: AAA family ATPase [Planctomycetota bacterium]
MHTSKRTPAPPLPKEFFIAAGEGAPTLDRKRRALAELRERYPEAAGEYESFLIEEATNGHGEREAAFAQMREMEAMLDRFTEPPLIIATYLGPAVISSGTGAVVLYANNRRVVPVAADVDLDSLMTGDEVLLSQDAGALTAKSPCPAKAYGETATFERMLSPARMLIRSHDDQIVVGIAGTTRDVTWEPGDLVRWDRASGLALEKVDAAENHRFEIDRVPDVGPDQVGGQDDVLKELIWTLTIAITRPDLARRYGLGSQQAILLVGKPGTGKTLMAKVAANEVRRLTGKDCRICVVRPGAFENEYVGVTQRLIRECFDSARACKGWVLIFLDEVESIGRVRGGHVSHHSDKFLASFLTELQGFGTDAADKIAVVAATNRRDLLDPALSERLEVQLEVKRPDRRGAREIFSIHLREEFAFSPNGKQAAATRSALIERAVSQFYNPNGDNAICTVRFSDRSERVINARELASGRCIEQVCRAAGRAAAFREAQGGDAGVRAADMDDAVADTLAKMSVTLTRANIRSYVADLPQDMEIVAVDPVVRRVGRPHRYLVAD